MPIFPSTKSQLGTLVHDSALSLLTGNPTLPDRQWARPISPLLKLLFIILCALQLCIFLVSGLGGVGLWVFVQWNGGNNPLTGSDSLLLSLLFEGWFVVGALLGLCILGMSRFWAIPPGVQWGWMGLRLASLVFVIFVPIQMTGLLNDETQSLATGLVLLLTSSFFLKHGWLTIDEVIHISSGKSGIRAKVFVKGEDLIFLSYRREDSQVWTDRIAKALKEHFGEKVVFQDVDGIPPGVDFRQHLQDHLAHCQAILVVIGPNWVSAKDAIGIQRLQKEHDWVKLEIEIGLERNLPIIPLLVDKTAMPPQKELPGSINELAFKNSLPIRNNPDFETDMGRLINSLERYVT